MFATNFVWGFVSLTNSSNRLINARIYPERRRFRWVFIWYFERRKRIVPALSTLTNNYTTAWRF